MKNRIFISILITLLILVAYGSFSQESFFKSSGGKDWTSNFSVGGEISSGSRYFVNPDTFGDFKDFKAENVTVYPYIDASFNLKYSGESAEACLDFSNPGYTIDITEPASITAYLKEAYIHYYLSPFDLLAGYAKVVWGKGDGVHVIDLLNANDYSDFINGDYLNRRISVPLLKLGIEAGEAGYLELAYEPVFVPDRYPESGMWMPAELSALQSSIETAVGNLVTDTYLSTYQSVLTATGDSVQAGLAASAAAEEIQNKAHYTLPDTGSLKYSQFAERYTVSLSNLDLGFSHYYGFVREPVIDTSNLATKGTVTISYDRLNAFGIEASSVLLGFNMWLEAAYNLTSDYSGGDPMVHNNSVQYIVGFDRNIPLHNLYVNLQLIGSYIINNNRIEEGDIQYRSDGVYHSNTLAWSLSDTFLNDVVKVQLNGAYNLEQADYMLRPRVDYALTDDLHMEIFYTYFQGDSGTNFGQFKDNSFAELKFSITF